MTEGQMQTKWTKETKIDIFCFNLILQFPFIFPIIKALNRELPALKVFSKEEQIASSNIRVENTLDVTIIVALPKRPTNREEKLYDQRILIFPWPSQWHSQFFVFLHRCHKIHLHSSLSAPTFHLPPPQTTLC